MKTLKLLRIGLCLPVLLWGACSRTESPGAKRNEPIRVACLGASNTRGYQLPRLDENCYPGQLKTIMGEGYLVENFGVGGSCALKYGRIPYWKTKAFKDVQQFKPDILVFDFGGNDFLREDQDQWHRFIPDYVDLIKTCSRANRKARIIVLCPIALYNDPTGSAAHFASMLKPLLVTVASQTGAETLDVYTPLKDDKLNFNYDQVHLSVKGCGMVADIVGERILNPVK